MPDEGQYFMAVDDFTPHQLFAASDDWDLADVTTSKIESFGELPAGWNYGEGLRISRSQIRAALDLNTMALQFGFLQRDAFPGSDGEVMLTIYEGDIYLEFTIETPEQIAFVREDDRVETDERDALSLLDIEELFRKLRKEICASYASSMESTTTSDGVSLRAWHSSPPAMEGSRLSVASA